MQTFLETRLTKARVGWSERSELQQLVKATLEFANAHSNLHGLKMSLSPRRLE